MAGRLDARAKLVAVVAAIGITGSTVQGELLPFAGFAFLTVLLVGAMPAPGWMARVLPGLPFVLLSAGVLALAAGLAAGLSVALKGTLALVLASWLASTTSAIQLVSALQRLGAPHALTLIAGLMLRFVDVLQEEFTRMTRARAARCGAPLTGISLFTVHGNQTGMLLVRSWERADRIHRAMVSRGYDGHLPLTSASKWNGHDTVFVAAVIVCFGLVRYFFAPGNSTLVRLLASIVTS